MAAAGTTPGAERFITETISIAADPALPGAVGSSAAKPDVAKPDVAKYSTIPVAPLSLSRATGRRPADTLPLAARAVHAPARSAVTTMAAKPGAIRPADNPASAAVAGSMVVAAVAVAVGAVAGVVDRNPGQNTAAAIMSEHNNRIQQTLDRSPDRGFAMLLQA